MQRVVFGLIACGLLAVQGGFTKAQDKAAESKPKAATQTVVAEGVGATADEAIKDAYRNAVRQVVGAVVDAETLVKDDEVIDDKVLTYSDGFIKDYEEIEGSKKTKGGLHRIKIKARVERRSVIAKLKSANVTVKEVDGKGLFAEAVTQLDAEKDAAALLKKQFEGFPQSCIKATVIGKPEIVEKTDDKATVRISIRIEPDLTAYKAFTDRLVPIVEKIAKDKGEFTAVFKFEEGFDKSFGGYFAPTESGYIEVIAGWMPKSFSGSKNSPRLKSEVATLALTTLRSKGADRMTGRYFLVDKSLQPILAELAFRQGHGKLSFVDSEGETVIVDKFPLLQDVPWNSGEVYDGTLVASAGHIYGNHLYMLGRGEERSESKKEAFLFWISPVFLQPNTNRIHHRPALQVTRTISLSLDELKSVKDAKMEVTFDE